MSEDMRIAMQLVILLVMMAIPIMLVVGMRMISDMSKMNDRRKK